MIEEAIKAICELSEESKRVQIVRADQEPPGTYYLVTGEGCTRVKADPPHRTHHVRDLDGLARLTTRLAEGAVASVWVSRKGVVALVDDSDRRDVVRLDLAPSPQMLYLDKWGKALTWYNQADLVRCLRNVFALSVRETNVVEVFRRLKWLENGSTEGSVQHGKQSIGKALQAEVTGSGSIPEDFVFREYAFDGAALRVGVVVPATVEINCKDQVVAFVPLAGAVEAAWIDAEEMLASRLVEQLGGAENVHVYVGSP